MGTTEAAIKSHTEIISVICRDMQRREKQKKVAEVLNSMIFSVILLFLAS